MIKAAGVHLTERNADHSVIIQLSQSATVAMHKIFLAS
jgi:hypothetical protein